MAEIRAELRAILWQGGLEEGQTVDEGDELVILESMKMEIPVVTDVHGVVREVCVKAEDVVREGDVIAVVDEA